MRRDQQVRNRPEGGFARQRFLVEAVERRGASGCASQAIVVFSVMGVSLSCPDGRCRYAQPTTTWDRMWDRMTSRSDSPSICWTKRGLLGACVGNEPATAGGGDHRYVRRIPNCASPEQLAIFPLGAFSGPRPRQDLQAPTSRPSKCGEGPGAIPGLFIF
jgi:hypothetical protein